MGSGRGKARRARAQLSSRGRGSQHREPIIVEETLEGALFTSEEEQGKLTQKAEIWGIHKSRGGKEYDSRLTLRLVTNESEVADGKIADEQLIELDYGCGKNRIISVHDKKEMQKMLTGFLGRQIMDHGYTTMPDHVGEAHLCWSREDEMVCASENFDGKNRVDVMSLDEARAALRCLEKMDQCLSEYSQRDVVLPDPLSVHADQLEKVAF